MAETRVQKIQELVFGALSGMAEYEDDASPAELISAAVTLARKLIGTTLKHHPEYCKTTREAVEVLLLECADVTQRN